MPKLKGYAENFGALRTAPEACPDHNAATASELVAAMKDRRLTRYESRKVNRGKDMRLF